MEVDDGALWTSVTDRHDLGSHSVKLPGGDLGALRQYQGSRHPLQPSPLQVPRQAGIEGSAAELPDPEADDGGRHANSVSAGVTRSDGTPGRHAWPTSLAGAPDTSIARRLGMTR